MISKSFEEVMFFSQMFSTFTNNIQPLPDQILVIMTGNTQIIGLKICLVACPTINIFYSSNPNWVEQGSIALSFNLSPIV